MRGLASGSGGSGAHFLLSCQVQIDRQIVGYYSHTTRLSEMLGPSQTTQTRMYGAWRRRDPCPCRPSLPICKVHAAYVRESHWSGKTLEPIEGGGPQILSFLGSQRFGSVQVQRTASAP